MKAKGCVKWPFLTHLLQAVSSDVRGASVVPHTWGMSHYFFVRVTPHPQQFWRAFKLKFSDWRIHAWRYNANLCLVDSTGPWFRSVHDAVGWISDTMGRPGIKGLLLLESMKYLSYQESVRLSDE